MTPLQTPQTQGFTNICSNMVHPIHSFMHQKDSLQITLKPTAKSVLSFGWWHNNMLLNKIKAATCHMLLHDDRHNTMLTWNSKLNQTQQFQILHCLYNSIYHNYSWDTNTGFTHHLEVVSVCVWMGVLNTHTHKIMDRLTVLYTFWSSCQNSFKHSKHILNRWAKTASRMQTTNPYSISKWQPRLGYALL